MKTASKERTLQWICNEYEKGNISFSHKLQRPIGQWNTKMQSLLIHSLLSGFPVNTIYIVDENDVLYPIDGSQRTFTCISYINNEFSLSKDTPNITITSKKNGESVSKTYEIAGKRFKKLDEDIQKSLLSCCLDFCTITDYTDNEIREMFRRQNNGKPLNGKQLRIVYESDAFSDAIYSLSTHPFMDKLTTNAQRKNGTDRDLIIQSLMLVETTSDHEFVSFRTKDIDNFVLNHADSIDAAKFDTLKNAMDDFDKVFKDVEIKIPVTSIPMVLYAGYHTKKGKGSFSKLVEIVKEFAKNYDTNEKYKQYVLSGTGNAENVRGRFDYWKNLIKNI